MAKKALSTYEVKLAEASPEWLSGVLPKTDGPDSSDSTYVIRSEL